MSSLPVLYEKKNYLNSSFKYYYLFDYFLKFCLKNWKLYINKNYVNSFNDYNSEYNFNIIKLINTS